MLRGLILTLFFTILPLPAVGSILTGLEASGSGTIRYLGFIKVYEATLFAPREANVGELLTPDCSRCLSLDYMVDVSVENFVEAAETILAQQHDPVRLAAVRKHIDLLHASYVDVGKNDNYTLCYDAMTRDTTLYLNGKRRVLIPSAADFSEIYFGIWLSEESPLDKNLRASLVAGLELGTNR
jgi:hypothetical protein